MHAFHDWLHTQAFAFIDAYLDAGPDHLHVSWQSPELHTYPPFVTVFAPILTISGATHRGFPTVPHQPWHRPQTQSLFRPLRGAFAHGLWTLLLDLRGRTKVSDLRCDFTFAREAGAMTLRARLSQPTLHHGPLPNATRIHTFDDLVALLPGPSPHGFGDRASHQPPALTPPPTLTAVGDGPSRPFGKVSPCLPLPRGWSTPDDPWFATSCKTPPPAPPSPGHRAPSRVFAKHPALQRRGTTPT